MENSLINEFLRSSLQDELEDGVVKTDIKQNVTIST